MATVNNSPVPASEILATHIPNMDCLIGNLDISNEQSSADGHTSRTFNVRAQNVSINAGQRNLPGTIAEKSLKLLIQKTKKTFVPTESFKHVQRTLDRFGHVTICGASGEGKTSMSLMMAREYMKKGFEVIFVERVDVFDYSQVICSPHKVMVIVDDIFGTVGLSTDMSHLKHFINSLQNHIQDRRDVPFAQRSGLNRRLTTSKSEIEQEKQDIRVVFTSKTYNLKEGLSKLHYERLSMFTGYTVVDLTTNKDHSYSDQEKIAMFEKHKIFHSSVKTREIQQQDLLNLDTTLFGFPMTCRLFFEFAAFQENVKDFFKRPLFYLRIELNELLSQNNNQTGALIMVLLSEEKLDLAKLECKGRDERMDEMFEHVTDVVPSVTRSGIAAAARSFRGTFFTWGDTLGFAHSSIYDACACAFFEFNPSFVLRYCSIDFLFERLKPGYIEETRISDHLHFLFVSDNYYDLVATRLVEAFKNGCFSKSLTHPLLSNDQFAKLLLTKLQSLPKHMSGTEWLHEKDKEKGVLFWAVQGPSVELLHAIETIFNIEFNQIDIMEALNGCTEKDDLVILTFLLSKLEQPIHRSTFQKLLWLSGENGSWNIAQYLLRQGAKVNTPKRNKQNFIHIACKGRRSDMLKSLISQVGSLVTRRDYLSAINCIDIDGRTAAMLAARYGSWNCFILISGDSKLDTRDIHGDSTIHLAAWGGSRDIVQHVLTPSNINTRGRCCLTPIMVAAVHGQQSAFDLLASNNADLSLLDVIGNSLLHLACEGGNIDVVKHVLTPSNINSRGQFGRTPVMLAASAGHKHIFDFLVSNSADLTLVDDEDNTLLHLACDGAGSLDIIRTILSPSNINSRGCWGNTPVIVAAIAGHRRLFDLLVSKHADLTLTDDFGNSVLHMACKGGNTHIVQQVLTPSNINTRGQYGWTPIMVAGREGHIKVFDLLVSNNADLSLVSVSGESLLHFACCGGNRDIVQHVLTPSNINTRGQYGWTPIMVAARAGHQRVFDLLVSNNADLSLVSDSSESLLHFACCGGNRDIVQHVLTPSNVNSRGWKEWTPAMVAACCGHKNILQILVEKQADLTLVDSKGRSALDYAQKEGKSNVVQYLKTVMQ